MNFKKIKKNHLIITYIVAFLLVILITETNSFLRDHKQFLYYHKLTEIFGWILIVVFLLILLWSLRKIYTTYKANQTKKGIISAFVCMAISLSFMLNLVQFKIYLSNPNSYIVDQRIKEYYVDKQILIIDSLILGYKNEIFLIDNCINSSSDSLIQNILVDKELQEVNPNYKYLGFAKLGHNLGIYFRENIVKHPVMPPAPPKPGSDILPIKTFDFDAINIVTDTLEIEILYNQSNSKYFDSIKNSIEKVNADLVIKILSIYQTERQERISLLNKNRDFIIKRGLPLGVFLIDSIQAFFGSFQDYKPLNWIGRLIETLQFMFSSIVFLPLVGEVYILVKKILKIK